MSSRSWVATAPSLLATLCLAMLALAPSAHASRPDDLLTLAGEWLYVEDLTEGRPTEEQQPPMSVTFGLRVEDAAVVVERAGGREERIATSDGLLVPVVVGDLPQLDSLALYRHPQDIPLPTPARASMVDLQWLAGAWVGGTGKSAIEERWGPPLGGAMLGVSRTVKRGAMVGFEYLRIVERDAGLVYVAQSGGMPPTEFVLTELHATRAVFDNPRHDSPQRAHRSSKAPHRPARCRSTGSRSLSRPLNPAPDVNAARESHARRGRFARPARAPALTVHTSPAAAGAT